MDTRTCLFCGQAELVDVFDAWGDHSFMVETCCESLREALTSELNIEADAAVALAVGHQLRRVVSHEGGLIADHALTIRPIPFRSAVDFVRKHHAHSRPPAGWKFGAGIFNGPTCVGVVVIGRPVSRHLDARKDALEVTRLCLDRALPRGLSWNACSQAYGWAAAEARKRGYARIITYTRADESGTSLRAAGWICEHRSVGGSWDRPSRSRIAGNNTVPKLRWAREFRRETRAAEA